eukprot:GFUD01013666.1.p1 GENE.GFUD01013666.1~~GFUD01013666.1.p1  ORF type:complete len:812 (-),score=155.83 GFUD01013666.1:49-2484(-)
MSERSETESERDLDGIDVVSEPDASSKRSSLRSGAGGVIDRNDSSPAPHQVLLAAAYLDDARSGTHMEFEPTVSAVNMYTTYKSWWFTGILYVALFIILGLAIFEEPAANSQYLPLPFYITVTLEILCVGFFMFRLAHEFLFSKKSMFWTDAKHIMIIIILALTLIDICIYTGLVESNISTVRWSRPLRPLLIVNIPEGRQIRRAFRNIRRTLPEISSVLILFLLVIFLFAMMFYKLFKNKGMTKVDGTPYFQNFFDSYWDLYVLVTTANSPDIMMPAYDQKAFYSIFFIVFEVVCIYIFMSIFLAVIYNNYRKNLKMEVKEAVERKRELIDHAFDMMKSDVFGREVIIQGDFNQLLKKTKPNKSEQYFKILWYVLDVDNNGYIDKSEFHNLPDLMNIKITEVKPNLCERFIPNVYRGKYSKMIIHSVKHKYFRYIFDAIILINAFVILSDLDYVEWGFLAIFTLEILLKIYAFGFYMFISKYWNIFDTIIIGSAFIFDIIDEARGDNADANIILDVLLILRVLRIIKIFHGVDSFKMILNTIMHILPSLLTYVGVLFVFVYIFAIVGMESFKNKIRFFGPNTYNTTDPEKLWCGNEALKDSLFYRDKYCANNFNDIGSAIVVLFELLVVNQWHIITDGFVLATGSKATRLFFIAYHMITVIIILNIFTAFVLEAFLLEYSYSKGALETALETKINEMGLAYGSKPIKNKPKNEGTIKESILDDDELDSDSVDADHDNLQYVAEQLEEIVRNYTNYSKDTDIRFHLKKGAMNVHTLLQKMFIHELELTSNDLKAVETNPMTDPSKHFDSFN